MATGFVEVLLFAGAAEAAKTSQARLALGLPASIAQIAEALVDQHPELASYIARSRFAVEHEFVHDDFVVVRESRIALIPPVSGG